MRKVRLMIPGPTEVSPEVCHKLSEPMLPHYGDDWSGFHHEVVGKVKKVFQTENELYIPAATSSSGMEMALLHAAEPGEKILVCNNGFFGDRFTEMAQLLGLEVVTVKSVHGEPITARQVGEALEKQPDVKALAIVHNESSTAVESPLEGILAETAKRDVISIVDCVSSMGGVDVPTDKLGIDCCISWSQKCFAAPAGLAFLSVSGKAWERIDKRRNPVRGWYLNLNIFKSYQQKWLKWHPQGPNTAPVSLYKALNQSLDEILAEGLQARFKRHVKARDAFRVAMRAMGLKLFVKDECASKTLTAVCLPNGVNGEHLRKNILARRDILLAGGLGETANTVIRIGHLAWTASVVHLTATIDAIEEELLQAGGKIERRGAAINEFKRIFGS